jgi:hypothetical protein
MNTTTRSHFAMTFAIAMLALVCFGIVTKTLELILMVTP